ncbi:hypothetical protein QZN29_25430 [Burkholderia multivorans]|uniref:hypothetical protein n=1 Tax=Burkholderia multivorans TaxID=87883 RepID=UPI0011B2740B|nr:hypothetical protein [Burkholderia multivorans]MDN8092990.1 hypothetical protein [Burkholderia multivorans]MDN8098491.1 hypothetical protein [Burkholderia multivorans]MDN8109586.1 hypothetical protein [Burkholderia multivorans]MDN8129472.1 hypothetical protein [Burkholderia multivorans]MDN8135126.1 hypothetical protein [Burkholderia multivorans]
MNLERLLVLLVATIAITSVRAADISSAAQARIGHLHCGDASLIATTAYLVVDGEDRQTLSQRIVLTSAGRRVPIVLCGDGRSLHQPFLKDAPVLDAAVTGWACLSAAGGKAYVYVVYICTESLLRPDCEGVRREWVRLFDTRGKPLNAGFPHEGQRTSEMMKKLGLGRYVNDGAPLKDVDDPLGGENSAGN